MATIDGFTMEELRMAFRANTRQGTYGLNWNHRATVVGQIVVEFGCRIYSNTWAGNVQATQVP
jgi:hypothetical protein